MILVESSVWIDYFRGTANAQSDRLDALLGAEQLLVGDVILTEVLQGFASDRDFEKALALMGAFECIDIGGQAVALEAARNFRRLRARGVTVRKTIDTLIATRCIMDGLRLLYADRDFDPFAQYLGLVSAMPGDR